MIRNLKIYRDNNDWWIGYYRGTKQHYIILIPIIVIRFDRREDGIGITLFKGELP